MWLPYLVKCILSCFFLSLPLRPISLLTQLSLSSMTIYQMADVPDGVKMGAMRACKRCTLIKSYEQVS